ncbi:transcription initiation factor IIB [Imshaugia aleurites]|uniref:Transcription initiation factor IIB n=1 Tax=Imshaugia aleurites TaxID=172621 RepID=A0A8H3IDD1_9LECA|nr:transcription initiation factor IIB [Imshaugia aleurites]
MSQDFLTELLSDSNTQTRSDQHQHHTCMICLEKYNTTNLSTGTLEREIRLPCSHEVGSACIATWLKTHNKCPLCRTVFFPAQPLPHLESATIHERIPATHTQVTAAPNPIIHDWNSTAQRCSALCLSLHLNDNTMRLAQSMADRLLVETRGPRCIAALCVYMASYITGQPKSILDISWEAGTSVDDINFIYRYVYPDRERLIDLEDLRRRGYVDTLSDLQAVPSVFWPPLAGAFTQFESS